MSSKADVGIAHINVNDVICVIDVKDLSMWPPKKTTLILLFSCHWKNPFYSYLDVAYIWIQFIM